MEGGGGAALWNSLPQALRECNSLGAFKKKVKVSFLLKAPTRQSCKSVDFCGV